MRSSILLIAAATFGRSASQPVSAQAAGDTTRGRPSTQAPFARRRVQIFLPTPFHTGTWKTVGSFETALRARGFGPGLIPGIRNATDEPTVVFAESGVRVRVRGATSLEALIAVAPKTATITGWRPQDSTYVTAIFSGTLTALLVGYEWRNLRLAAGPAVVWNSWSLAADQLTQVPGSTGQDWISTALGADHWSERVVGFLGQVSYVIPISTATFLEARADLRSFGNSQTHGIAPFGPVGVDHSGHNVAVGIGFAF
jgi:hypothetical protein